MATSQRQIFRFQVPACYRVTLSWVDRGRRVYDAEDFPTVHEARQFIAALEREGDWWPLGTVHAKVSGPLPLG